MAIYMPNLVYSIKKLPLYLPYTYLDNAILGVKPPLPWSKVSPIIVTWSNLRLGIKCLMKLA